MPNPNFENVKRSKETGYAKLLLHEQVTRIFKSLRHPSTNLRFDRVVERE